MPVKRNPAMRLRSFREWVLSRFVHSAVSLTLALLTGMIAVAHSQSIDPHRLYEQSCGGCHSPHAGSFVDETLVQSDGDIFGRKSGRELRAFLEAGHGGLSQDEIASIVDHLASILRSGRIFQNKCITCHDRAVVLARRELVLRDGELIGRYTNRNIGEFLSGHGRLSSEEVSKMVDVLKRQLSTKDQ